MTFRTRSFLAALITAAVTLAVVEVMVSWSVRRTVGQRIERGLVDEARLAAATLVRRPPASAPELDAHADALGQSISARVTIVSADGTVAGDSERSGEALQALENHGDRPEIVQALREGVGVARRFSETLDVDMLYVAVAVQDATGASPALVRLALPLTEVREQIAAVRRSILLAGLVGLATALLLAWVTSALLTRRLRALAAMARRYAAGDFSRPARDYGSDEIGAVARVLDDSVQEVSRRAAEVAADRARMEAILAGMAEGVLVVSREGQIQLVNAAARRMLRLTGQPEGSHYVEIVRQPDVAALVATALAGGQGESVELSLPSDLNLVVRGAPVLGEAGSGAVIVLHDITSLRRADRVRRDFVANVSHELRTPLTAVRGYVEALLEGDASAEEARRFLEIISRHTLRMERLVRDLLRLARLDAGQESLEHTACEVDDLFAGVEAELGASLAARRLRVERRIDPDAAIVHGDPVRLHDAFRNLLENAINYSPEGAAIEMSARRANGRILLTVADQGPGIPESDLGRVFERFYRVDKARSRSDRDPGGTGLGLAIVKHLIELHGGTITASNGQNGGAVFTVELSS